jgi:cellulose synthase/poly-beta-1,6-N-acetylglucosamine synthase-like glycosyltransferase
VILPLIFSLIGLVIFFCCLYLWLIALAARRSILPARPAAALVRFAIAIPAHNEEVVIGQTVATLRQMAYPQDRYDIFVVADNCSDRTAEYARAQGAICYERATPERRGKGPALQWLFAHIFNDGCYQAVVVFDADTQVSPDFLTVMNNRLAQGNSGCAVIQGRHVISNPRAGWFPALTWAMMTIDCRLYSQGRANLGLSARHMGDSICFRTEVLERIGWGSGLTEDYELRLQLLLEGVRIAYEPAARGYGQAPTTWQEAQAQRVRWASGIANAGQRYRKQLLIAGMKRRNWSILDGALGAMIPSYSTLTMIALLLAGASLVWNAALPGWLPVAGLAILALCFIYPWFGLMLEKAPGWAYLAILSGPLFMIWRTWIKLLARWRGQKVNWVRTPHRR